jgi:anti-anti-sigma factor
VQPTVVWLAGEHDISNDDALRRTLARAIAVGSTALVVDLGEVRFMSARTLQTISQAREFLRRWSGSLTVRSASPFLRRTIDICGLNDLLGPDLEEAGQALGSWVAVPTEKRCAAQAGPPETAPTRHLASVGRPAARRAAWGSRRARGDPNTLDREEPCVGARAHRRARLVGLLADGANSTFGAKRLCQGG